MTQDTYILSRESQMNKGYILGGAPITKKIAKTLFDGQRVLESQFMYEMPIIVMHASPPKDAIHVADETYLVPPDLFESLGDIDHFLVNQPFCEILETEFLEMFDVLVAAPDKIIACDKTYMIGAAHGT